MASLKVGSGGYHLLHFHWHVVAFVEHDNVRVAKTGWGGYRSVGGTGLGGQYGEIRRGVVKQGDVYGASDRSGRGRSHGAGGWRGRVNIARGRRRGDTVGGGAGRGG